MTGYNDMTETRICQGLRLKGTNNTKTPSFRGQGESKRTYAGTMMGNDTPARFRLSIHIWKARRIA